MAQLAEQMGNEGKGSLLPRWTTGRSALAKGTGLAFGSPRIASQVTLPTTQAVGSVGKKIESLAQPFKSKQKVKLAQPITKPDEYIIGKR